MSDGLKELIQKYMHKIYLRKGSLLDFGVLEDFSVEPDSKLTASLLDREGIIWGSIKTTPQYNRVTIWNNTPYEKIKIRFNKKRIQIHLQPPSIQAEVPSHRFPRKEDWINPKGIEIEQPGDYTAYLAMVRESMDSIRQGGKRVHLYIPELIS